MVTITAKTRKLTTTSKGITINSALFDSEFLELGDELKMTIEKVSRNGKIIYDRQVFDRVQNSIQYTKKGKEVTPSPNERADILNFAFSGLISDNKRINQVLDELGQFDHCQAQNKTVSQTIRFEHLKGRKTEIELVEAL